MALFAISWVAVAQAFYILGRNQIEYDEIPLDDRPRYADLLGSFQFAVYLCLGEVGDWPSFQAGTGEHAEWLWALFVASSFWLIINIMNVLIAIMGDVQSNHRA